MNYIKNLLFFLPMFVFGGVAGLYASELSDMWCPVWYDCLFFIGIPVLMILLYAIWVKVFLS